MVEYRDCCYDCGKKRYGTKLKEGITVHGGICPFCNEMKTIIPRADWMGLGD